MLSYRRNGQQRYHQRTTCNISCEWEVLQMVRDIAAERRMTLSEIVGEAFIKFINQHKGNTQNSNQSF